MAERKLGPQPEAIVAGPWGGRIVESINKNFETIFRRLKELGSLITGDMIDPDAEIPWSAVDKTGSSLADLETRSASDLSSGTLPDGRFPAVLPAVDGSLLTGIVHPDWSVLTNGDPDNPEVVFDSDGDVIMVETP